MNYRKMFLVNENEFNEFKEDKKARENQTEQKMNEMNTKFIQNKIATETVSDAEWGKLGNRLTPIIQKGVIQPEDNSAENLFDMVKTKVSPTMLPRAVKLFSFLNEIPMVELKTRGILVDGTPLLGSLGDIIADLVKGKQKLTYDTLPLLKILSNYPSAKKLIFNKEAQKIVSALSKSDSGAEESDDLDYSSPIGQLSYKKKASRSKGARSRRPPIMRNLDEELGEEAREKEEKEGEEEEEDIFKTPANRRTVKKGKQSKTPKRGQKGSGIIKRTNKKLLKKKKENGGKSCPKKPKDVKCIWESLFG